LKIQKIFSSENFLISQAWKIPKKKNFKMKMETAFHFWSKFFYIFVKSKNSALFFLINSNTVPNKNICDEKETKENFNWKMIILKKEIPIKKINVQKMSIKYPEELSTKLSWNCPEIV
jgi:hypothetical protein